MLKCNIDNLFGILQQVQSLERHVMKKIQKTLDKESIKLSGKTSRA